jgi:ABC-type sugar transport system ATPase subunit
MPHTSQARETIVEIEGLCKTFPGVRALDGVRFDLRAGEVMALLGDNGAKTSCGACWKK